MRDSGSFNNSDSILDFNWMLQILTKPHFNQWYFALFLLGISLCTSKSLFTILTVIIVLWAFFDKSKYQLWFENKWLVSIASLFPIAIMLSFFSLGGKESALIVIKNWYWPLLACPVAVAAFDRKSISPLLSGFLIGLVIASLHSYFNAFQVIFYHQDIVFMSDAFRVTSYWDVSRWGFFSGFSILLLLQLLAVSNAREKIIYGSILSFTLLPFLFTNARAPLLALTIISSILIFSDRKVRKYALLFLAFVMLFGGTIPKYQERFLSIFQLQRHEEKLVPTNQSNLARINMWNVALDFYKEQPFFGTGYENSETPLRQFLISKGDLYNARYVSDEFSNSDQHSSYLTALVQFGLIFAGLSFSLFFIIFIKVWVVFRKQKSFIRRFSLIGLSYCFIIFFFYSALSSYEAAVFFVLLSLGALSFNKGRHASPSAEYSSQGST